MSHSNFLPKKTNFPVKMKHYTFLITIITMNTACTLTSWFRPTTILTVVKLHLLGIFFELMKKNICMIRCQASFQNSLGSITQCRYLPSAWLVFDCALCQVMDCNWSSWRFLRASLTSVHPRSYWWKSFDVFHYCLLQLRKSLWARVLWAWRVYFMEVKLRAEALIMIALILMVSTKNTIVIHQLFPIKTITKFLDVVCFIPEGLN